MKHVLTIVLALGGLSALTGCVVYSEEGRTASSRSRSRSTHSSGNHDCGPAHHWDGDSCVHNGKAKGHYKK